MSNIISSEILKRFRDDLCGCIEEDVCLVEADYCDKNPKSVDLSEYSVWKSFIPDFFVDSRQDTVEVCRSFHQVLDEYATGKRECATSEDPEKCKKDLKLVKMISDECDDEVLKYHDKIDDFRGWIIGGAAGGLGLLIKFIRKFFKKMWFEKKKGGDATAEIFRTIDRIRSTKGFKNRVVVALKSIPIIRKIWEGSTEKTEEIQEQSRIGVARDWPIVRKAFTNAQEEINRFLENLDPELRIRSYPEMNAVNLSQLIGASDDELMESLRAMLFDGEEAIKSYQFMGTILEDQLATILSGQLLPIDGKPTLEQVEKALDQTKTYRTAVDSFLEGNAALLSVVRSIGSAYSVDPIKNANWQQASAIACSVVVSFKKMLDKQVAFLETLLTDLTEDKKDKIDIHLKKYRSLSNLTELIKKVVAVNDRYASRMGVDLKFKEVGYPIEVPSDIQIPLFIILNALIDNSVNYSDPGNRRSDAEVVVEYSYDGENIHIKVVDNGVGMDPSRIPQTEESRGTIYREKPDLAPGLGVDLRDAYLLASMHGIEIKHAQRKRFGLYSLGTEVQISAKAPKKGSETPPTSGGGGRGRRVPTQPGMKLPALPEGPGSTSHRSSVLPSLSRTLSVATPALSSGIRGFTGAISQLSASVVFLPASLMRMPLAASSIKI